MIVVVGPEGSGTHMLRDLLDACGLDVTTRSLPYAGIWWMGDSWDPFDPVDWTPWPEDVRFVVIRRLEWPTLGSVIRRRMAPDEDVARAHRTAALRLLDRLPATRVGYEDIVMDPRAVIGGLAAVLGGTLPDDLPEVRDENLKWLPRDQ